jgi:hypothetical protein
MLKQPYLDRPWPWLRASPACMWCFVGSFSNIKTSLWFACAAYLLVRNNEKYRSLLRYQKTWAITRLRLSCHENRPLDIFILLKPQVLILQLLFITNRALWFYKAIRMYDVHSSTVLYLVLVLLHHLDSSSFSLTPLVAPASVQSLCPRPTWPSSQTPACPCARRGHLRAEKEK